jgi:hypothetical protein
MHFPTWLCPAHRHLQLVVAGTQFSEADGKIKELFSVILFHLTKYKYM